MASSPYIPEEVKNYIKKHTIEKIVNDSVNSLLKTRPEDPFAFMVGQFQKFASAQIDIKDVKGFEIITGQGWPAMKIFVTCIYMNQEVKFFIPQPLGILADQGMIFDEDRHGGKGQKKGIAFLEKNLVPKISGMKCSEQLEIDNRLLQQLTANQNAGLYQVNTMSYLPSLVQSHILSKPLFEVFAQLAEQQLNFSQIPIKIMVNCLHGGKAIGSKCKVFKYMLIGSDIKDPWLLQSVLQAVRKSIVSGKGGQAALKFSPDGTFICPLDTINDNLKIVEDAISSCNAKDHFTIGLSWMADTLFSPDTKKYELENPKTPFDSDQMIDYLIKLLTDKPVIQYLEDPLAPSEKAAWKKLIAKIRETQAIKTVKVGSRNGKLFNVMEGNVKEQIAEICIPMDEDSHPDATQEQRNQGNANKFSLDCIQFRGFELKTISKLLSIRRDFTKVKTQIIVQDNAYETYDTSIIDLCYGLTSYANLGSINKYDRISKLNRMAQILAQKQNH